MKYSILLGLCGAALLSFAADYQVSDPSWDGNDYAVANQGQLKAVATYWARELAFSEIGASDEIYSLCSGLTQAGNNSVVNLGQLKMVARPFYDHLNSVAPGVITHSNSGDYPWSNPESPPNDYAVANIGQLKYVMNFDLSGLQAGSLSSIGGEVTYSGSQTGTVYVIASPVDGKWSRLFEDKLEGSLAFPETFSIQVSDSNTYWVAAFIDVDGNGMGSGTDPWAISSFNMVDAGTTTLTLTLQDALPGEWDRLNYFGTLYPERNYPQGGLVLDYSFHGNADDESGNGYDGTVYNAALTTDRMGMSSSAYAFDGNGDYIRVGSQLNVPSWSDYAISVWFLNDGGGSHGNYGQKILDKTYWYHDFYLSLKNNGGILYKLYEGSSRVIYDYTYDYRDAAWHHVVVSKSNTVAQMWIDGMSIGVISNAVEVFSSSGLLIGYSESGDSLQRTYWSGKLDDIRIYNRSLKLSEIDELYFEGDTDRDGVYDEQEYINGSNWQNPDSDGDELPDGLDAYANSPDADGDGLGDGAENELAKSLAEYPMGEGVLINVPSKGFYHAAETNLTLNYLGGR